jgi:CBS domain-containing protein
MNAGEIMTANPISIKAATPVLTAAKLLADHKITAVPVISEDGSLIGIVSEKDILKLLYSSNADGITADKIMTKKVTSFELEAELFDLCETFIEHEFKSVPICSKGKLKGMISRHDLIRVIMAQK